MNTAKQKLASVKMYGRNVSEFLLPDQLEFIEQAMEEYAKEFHESEVKKLVEKFCKHQGYGKYSVKEDELIKAINNICT